MKIGIFLEADLDKPGGVQEHALGLYDALEKQGHQPWLIVPGPRPKEGRRLKVLGRKLALDRLTRITGASVPVVISLARPTEIKNFLVQEKFTVLHWQAPFGILGYQLLWQSRQEKITKAATFHIYSESSLIPNLVNFTLGPVLRPLSSLLDARIAVSPAARDYAQKMFPGEYLIIPNAVDVNRFRPQGARIEKFLDEKKNILFVGRLDRRKGVIHLLRAFALVKKEFSRARLIIVGSGTDEARAKQLVRDEGFEDVVFAGFVSSGELPNFYRTADIACFPALRDESFGIVLIEALASARPVVAFKNRGYEGVLKAELGRWLVPVGKVEALAEALLSLLKDEQLRKKYGQLGFQAAQEYSWQKISSRIVEVYQRSQQRSTSKAG